MITSACEGRGESGPPGGCPAHYRGPTHVSVHRASGPSAVVVSVLGCDGASRVGVQHAPRNELLGQHGRRYIVDHCQGSQIVGSDGQHLPVVVTSLSLDRGGVAGQWPSLLGRNGLE